MMGPDCMATLSLPQSGLRRGSNWPCRRALPSTMGSLWTRRYAAAIRISSQLATPALFLTGCSALALDSHGEFRVKGAASVAHE